MRRLKAILPLLIILLTGCASTRQLVPMPSTQTVSPQQARISVNGNRNISPAFMIKDGATEIGSIGRNGALTWDRPAGLCQIEASIPQDGGAFGQPGQMAGRLCVLNARLTGGRQYTFDLVRNKGIFSFQPTPDTASGITQINLPICILPVIDATGGRGIGLEKYAGAYNLPKAKSGSYFPANWALRELTTWGYTKPFYGGEQADVQAIYTAAKLGSVPKTLLPADSNPAYYLLVAVQRFDDAFRVIWLANSTVECYLIRSADGKIVYHATGEGSGRGRTFDADKKMFIQAYKFPELSDGDAWQQAIWEATYKAVKDIPVLEP